MGNKKAACLSQRPTVSLSPNRHARRRKEGIGEAERLSEGYKSRVIGWRTFESASDVDVSRYVRGFLFQRPPEGGMFDARQEAAHRADAGSNFGKEVNGDACAQNAGRQLDHGINFLIAAQGTSRGR